MILGIQTPIPDIFTRARATLLLAVFFLIRGNLNDIKEILTVLEYLSRARARHASPSLAWSWCSWRTPFLGLARLLERPPARGALEAQSLRVGAAARSERQAWLREDGRLLETASLLAELPAVPWFVGMQGRA